MSKGIVIHAEVGAAFERLSLVQRGELVSALLYWANGKKYEFEDRSLIPFWGWLEAKQEEISRKYDEMCAKKRVYASMRGSTSKHKLAQASTSKHMLAQAITNEHKPYNPNPNPNPTLSKDSGCAGAQATTTGDLVLSSDAPDIKNKTEVSFDYESGTFFGLGENMIVKWQSAYPNNDIIGEIRSAAMFLCENPGRKYKNYSAFLGNWFRKSAKDSKLNACGMCSSTSGDGRCSGGLLA